MNMPPYVPGPQSGLGYPVSTAAMPLDIDNGVAAERQQMKVPGHDVPAAANEQVESPESQHQDIESMKKENHRIGGANQRHEEGTQEGRGGGSNHSEIQELRAKQRVYKNRSRENKKNELRALERLVPVLQDGIHAERIILRESAKYIMSLQGQVGSLQNKLKDCARRYPYDDELSAYRDSFGGSIDTVPGELFAAPTDIPTQDAGLRSNQWSNDTSVADNDHLVDASPYHRYNAYEYRYIPPNYHPHSFSSHPNVFNDPTNTFYYRPTPLNTHPHYSGGPPIPLEHSMDNSMMPSVEARAASGQSRTAPRMNIRGGFGHISFPKAPPGSSGVTYATSMEEIVDQFANMIWPSSVAAGSIPPPLPPSVEEAYRKKCIELKRRMTEVEESNDAFRLRKARLTRGIRKMRLERAYLLEILGKRMKKNGSSIDGFQQAYDEESEGSSEGPPTPHEKPLRSKRSHRRPISSPPPMLGHPHPRPIAPSQAHSTSAFEHPRDPFRESTFQRTPTTNGHTGMHYQPRPNTFPLHSSHPHDQHQYMYSPPQPPQPAFDAFLEYYIKPKPEEFPRRNDEELIHVAKAAWETPFHKEYKDFYEEKYEKRFGEYQQKLGEWERERERERRDGQMEVEVQRELPPPPPQQVQAPPASGGGFTSING